MTSYVYRTLVPFSACPSHVWFDFSFFPAYTCMPLSSKSFRYVCGWWDETKTGFSYFECNVNHIEEIHRVNCDGLCRI